MSQFFFNNKSKTRRQEEIFHNFISLVKTNCRTKRDVEFYADKLCISPRYLSAVCTQTTLNKSAKRLIDQMAVFEIKILLETINMAVQKIAEVMNFPDQSYLCRFFKRYIGESPQSYRLSKNRIKGIKTEKRI
ncbi:MAG: helix-turn-helix domain-containing protein [Rikenellaceae bacterium]|nr:helix-turn-helix domain-containing protein [Rikenellaceae bacterium]